MVYFKNEKGILIEQQVEYEWNFIQCRGCMKFVYEEYECRKKNLLLQVLFQLRKNLKFII